MTTEAEDAIRVKTWPYWAAEQDAKRIKFKAIVATLSYAGVNERGPSYKFVEDPTLEQGSDGKTYKGRFWRLQGPYDTQTRTFAVAPDPGFKKGDRVRVVLEASMSGSNIYGNVTSIQAAPASTESAASPARAAEGQRDETRASIERQVLVKEARVAVEWILQEQGGTDEPIADRYYRTLERTLGEFARIFYETASVPWEPTTEIQDESPEEF